MKKPKLITLTIAITFLVTIAILVSLLWAISTSSSGVFSPSKRLKFVAIHNQKKSTDTNPVNVVVVSGGGVMAIIPLTVLQYLEMKSGKPLSQSADLFVGTSSGAIALAQIDNNESGNANQLNSALHAKKAFIKFSPSAFKTSAWRKIVTLNGLIGPLHSHHTQLELLKHSFGNAHLNAMKKKLMFISFDVSQEKVVKFKSWMENTPYANIPIYKLLTAATSAPVLFPPYPLQFTNQSHPSLYIDGGVISNTPELLAYLEARKLFPKRNIRIISLGDGTYKDILAPYFSKLTSLGTLSWANQIIKIFVQGHTILTNENLKSLVNMKGSKLVSFYRINMAVPSKHFRPFDGSKENLAILERYANQLVTKKKKVLDEIAQQLHH